LTARTTDAIDKGDARPKKITFAEMGDMGVRGFIRKPRPMS
jgi:hypothetical protein